jgi:hypothetical protein
MKTKIYIAGRMTGLANYNYHNFKRVERILQSLGYAVINPARNFSGDTELPRDFYIRQCIHDLLNADAIYLFGRWMESDGARLEHSIARELGLHIFHSYRKPEGK